jgi:sterol desaturase/sphingolipid hydroxylase (fatty acid hydroxylase superfamily)
MEAYGKILLVAMPIFLLLCLAETWYGKVKGKQTVRQIDMISSLSSGITNVTKDVLGLSVSIITYQWLESNVAVVQLQETWLLYLIAFLALDFNGYWVHRIAHSYNFFWNNHLIHHSSEEFNLACALRQSISVFVKIFVIFLLPAALLGVPAKVIAIVAPLHLFAQFWYHTQHINKMGWLENIIVTPSHHRVHHAINKEYIDKNYSQIFIFWDKFFGTFQAELPTIKPVYGITIPVQTWNPIKINFKQVWQLLKDAWHTKNFYDKFKLWFMPTGWRPKDVTTKFPLQKIENVYSFNKYNKGNQPIIIIWSWMQFVIVTISCLHLFGNIVKIGSPNMFWYGCFIFLQVYAFTDLMDENKWVFIPELLKIVFVASVLLVNKNWFGIESVFVSYSILAYSVMSLLGVIWIERQLKTQLNIFS